MRFALAVLVAVSLSACEKDIKVEVSCNGNGSDAVVCNVKHVSGAAARVCWKNVIECKNAAPAIARTCTDSDPDSTVNKLLHDDDFSGIENCQPVGSRVEDVVVTKR